MIEMYKEMFDNSPNIFDTKLFLKKIDDVKDKGVVISYFNANSHHLNEELELLWYKTLAGKSSFSEFLRSFSIHNQVLYEEMLDSVAEDYNRFVDDEFKRGATYSKIKRVFATARVILVEIAALGAFTFALLNYLGIVDYFLT